MRDEKPPVIPADKWERAGIVIVGAGIAGLSAARRLLAKGYDDFVVLELDDRRGRHRAQRRERARAPIRGARTTSRRR